MTSLHFLRTKVIRIGEDHLTKWYSVQSFRKDTVDRCDQLAAQFRCSVELRGPDGVLYKVFC